jgi:hypothetical protein
MSLRVLVISEDQSDWHILGPLVNRMFREIGKPNANINPCLEPKIAGVRNALKWEIISDIIDMNPFVDIFLLIVDRDGEASRIQALQNIESTAAKMLRSNRVLIGENAWQEIEVWAIAGQSLPAGWKWADIRAENHPKELYFEPLAAQRDLLDEPGAGRTTMGREAAAQYDRVRSRCPEDIQRLEHALQTWLAAN